MRVFLVYLSALLLGCGMLTGCKTEEATAAPEPVKEVKKSKARSGKKKNKIPDPIGDMLKIERKESKPLVTESELLSKREREVFEASWKNQHDSTESLHQRMRERQEENKKKQRDWVY